MSQRPFFPAVPGQAPQVYQPQTYQIQPTYPVAQPEHRNPNRDLAARKLPSGYQFLNCKGNIYRGEYIVYLDTGIMDIHPVTGMPGVVQTQDGTPVVGFAHRERCCIELAIEDLDPEYGEEVMYEQAWELAQEIVNDQLSNDVLSGKIEDPDS